MEEEPLILIHRMASVIPRNIKKIWKNPQAETLGNTSKTIIAALKRLDKNDYKGMIQAELYIMVGELVSTKSGPQKTSLSNGIDEAQQALRIFKNHEKYPYDILSDEVSVSAKSRDSSNLPKDSCRVFLASQRTRLRNRSTDIDITPRGQH
jgi:hypothetical protein